MKGKFSGPFLDSVLSRRVSPKSHARKGESEEEIQWYESLIEALKLDLLKYSSGWNTKGNSLKSAQDAVLA